MVKTLKICVLIFLGATIVFSQIAYDSSRAVNGARNNFPSAEIIKFFDLGLHSALASFFWVDVRGELPFLRQGSDYFLSGLKLVNDLDPRWSEPYAFSVLVLPNSTASYSEKISKSLEIGEEGLAKADPDWRVPFYMGATYHLQFQDYKNAAKYFDIAAITPGIPEVIRRFAVNYGIHPNYLNVTRATWKIIKETSSDETTRGRAEAHIEHLDILEYLNAGVKSFYSEKGRYPNNLEEVVVAGKISNIPEDPFGFKFKIYEGGVVGIAP